MSASSSDKREFREFVQSQIAKTTQICVSKGVELGLGRPSLNLIVAGELIRLGSAFAIRLGADEDDVASLARGCYNEARALVRARPAGLF